LIDRPHEFGVAVGRDDAGARLIDCGVNALGGLEAGRAMAEVCLAGLGRVDFPPGRSGFGPGPDVAVITDHPVAACMAAQYAGWQVVGEGYYAMGSGPMRAARGREELLEHIGCRERPEAAIGVLESGRTPPPELTARMAEECGVGPQDLTLLVARTSSLAGSVQIVARTVETALHKMHELGFDLRRVCSGYGLAPLPAAAPDDIAAIGRTNDAVLYGGEATLWVRGDDESLIDFGARLPSCSSPDHGRPFADIFEQYERDFYKIDPLLFSPAVVTLVNVDTGRWHRFGRCCPDILQRSFAR
jgi:methenyltetrahydromethanopterin cyclohydrolase